MDREHLVGLGLVSCLMGAVALSTARTDLGAWTGLLGIVFGVGILLHGLSGGPRPRH